MGCRLLIFDARSSISLGDILEVESRNTHFRSFDARSSIPLGNILEAESRDIHFRSFDARSPKWDQSSIGLG